MMNFNYSVLGLGRNAVKLSAIRLVIFFCALMLTACGGGGGGSSFAPQVGGENLQRSGGLPDIGVAAQQRTDPNLRSISPDLLSAPSPVLPGDSGPVILTEGVGIVIRIYASGPAPNGGISVNLAIEGPDSAEEIEIVGGECTGLSCTVIIPGGVSEVLLTLRPLADATEESFESWRVVIISSDDYSTDDEDFGTSVPIEVVDSIAPPPAISPDEIADVGADPDNNGGDNQNLDPDQNQNPDSLPRFNSDLLSYQKIFADRRQADATISAADVVADRAARFRKGEDGFATRYDREGAYFRGALGISEPSNPQPPAPLAAGESFFREQLEFAALGVWVTGNVADANFRYANLAENVVTPPPTTTDPARAISAIYFLEGDFTYGGARFYPNGRLGANFDAGRAHIHWENWGFVAVDEFGGYESDEVGEPKAMVPDLNDVDSDGDVAEMRPVDYPDRFVLYIRHVRIESDGFASDENTEFLFFGDGVFEDLRGDSELTAEEYARQIAEGREPYLPPLGDRPEISGTFHDGANYDPNAFAPSTVDGYYSEYAPAELSGVFRYQANPNAHELKGGFLGKKYTPPDDQ